MQQVRLILVGGFLGAGKTTLLGEAARRLIERGNKVGLITNDQADDLVDTGLLKQMGFGLGEVSGGCFCCRFDDLVGAADRLIEELKPDVLLGEPVGSCTDLSATVLQPLKELYADWFQVAPFSVLADPGRLREALVPGSGAPFPESVRYIFEKQLEEADAVVLNKTDLLKDAELAELKDAVAVRLPRARFMTMSALTGRGVDAWLDFALGGAPAGQRLAEVDYDTYAEGEAVLGWLNASVDLCSEQPEDWRRCCLELLADLRDRLQAATAEIAHLKLLLTTADGSFVANLTSSDGEPAMRGDAGGETRQAALIVNARVHIAPEMLQTLVEEALQRFGGPGVAARVVQLRSFSPSRPDPTHRYGAVVAE